MKSNKGYEEKMDRKIRERMKKMERNTRKLKMLLVIAIFLLGIWGMGRNNSQAALQANPTTHASPKQDTRNKLDNQY